VIDSGVNPLHPHIGRVAGGISIGAEGQESNYLDRLGHGTAVTAAVKEKAPEAEYFAVRVFHNSLRTNIDCLLKAIDWCIAQDMTVINLSLGTSNVAHSMRFEKAIVRASEGGAILVSARDVDGAAALPGSLPGVIGVGLDWDWPRESYACRKSSTGLQFYASGYPRALPGLPRERNLHGISFAVANMTGFVVRACEGLQDRCYASVCAALSLEAARLKAMAEL
jgi:hypothetical protein